VESEKFKVKNLLILCKIMQKVCTFAGMKASFLIAAPTSGSGKTTIARGLMALLTLKGLKVQPFKCGPDYIDTKFHEAVCGRPSINLDTFMASPEHVRELFWHYGEDTDVCIVEGMMGLFDGYDREKGSAYEIAKTLDIPIVLVVDAKSAAYSMAALLSGFIHFRQDVRFAGVIYNKVGSEKHFQMLQQVCDDLQIKCLGYLPKDASLEQGSRYLGLDFSEQPETRKLINLLEEHVDWRALTPDFIPNVGIFDSQCGNILFPVWEQSVLLARNSESFSFIYQETIDRFSSVRFFDPETEVPDFSGIDLLYLPGGYPEKHLEALVRNEACRKAIKDFAEQDGKVVAECGGMMYLCESIVTDEGEYPMCGVLPYRITARKADRKLSLGYRQFELDGKTYRGHEFHYTQFFSEKSGRSTLGRLQGKKAERFGEVPPSATQVYDAKGHPVATPVFKYKNVLASYTHLYQI
jgi:cobyrinic acid a,c-diamide synthase